MGFKKYLETSVEDEDYTAVWKCIRVMPTTHALAVSGE
jgi:hypothetical protein